jgi:hypothetical protein
MLPIFLTSLVYAPKALTLRPTRAGAAGALMAGLVTFTVLGAMYGPRTSMVEGTRHPWRQ